MDFYFIDIPSIGSLRIEHVFYEYEEPVLFVCLDQDNNRYLCSCSRIAEQWILSAITDSQLLEIMNRTLAIDKFFKECDHCICVKWDGERISFSFDIPDDAYPKDDTCLRLDQNKTKQYRSLLESISADSCAV